MHNQARNSTIGASLKGDLLIRFPNGKGARQRSCGVGIRVNQFFHGLKCLSTFQTVYRGLVGLFITVIPSCAMQRHSGIGQYHRILRPAAFHLQYLFEAASITPGRQPYPEHP